MMATAAASPEAARARGWIQDTLAHHQAEMLRINREVTRKKMGVEQADLPYPASQRSEVHNHYYQLTAPPVADPTPATKPDPASPVALTTGGVGQTPPAAGTPAGKWRGIREQQLADGTWVIIKVSLPFDSEAAAMAAV